MSQENSQKISPSPLKNKIEEWRTELYEAIEMDASQQVVFDWVFDGIKKDVAAAVQLLRKELCGCSDKWDYKCFNCTKIDEAFADEVKDE